MGLACANKRGEFIQEFVGPELVGIVCIEVGIERIEVIAQNCLCRLDAAEQRNRPRPWTGAAVRVSDIWRKRASPIHHRPRTLRFLSRGSSLPWARSFALLVAPLRI